MGVGNICSGKNGHNTSVSTSDKVDVLRLGRHFFESRKKICFVGVNISLWYREEPVEEKRYKLSTSRKGADAP